MENLEKLLSEHPFFKNLKSEYRTLLTECASMVQVNAGEHLFREGEPAHHFYFIREGRMALELFVPGQGPITIETLGAGDVLGWSWLFPPYRWHFDARAVHAAKLIALNGSCLRPKYETDPALGFELMKGFAHIMIQRLQATQMQLLELNEFAPREKHS